MIFYGTEGYVVLTSYTGGRGLRPAARSSTSSSGDGDHYGQLPRGRASRKPEDLDADILEGHLSAALAHTGTISYRLGETISLADRSRNWPSSRATTTPSTPWIAPSPT